MSIRFRRSIKLAPGIRWNVSGGGSSFSLGPRGASVSTGSRGTFFNAGLPGTGLSSRQRLAPAAKKPSSNSAADSASVKMTCSVSESGALEFVDSDGNPIPEHLVEIAKKQNREALLGLIQRACDLVNDEVQALAQIHLTTPRPDVPPRFVALPFDEAAPVAPTMAKVGFIAGLVASKRNAIEAANLAARQAHEEALAQWRNRKAGHEAAQDRARALFERVAVDPDAMAIYLDERLQGVEWPRETDVAYEVRDAGKHVVLDVDLPEIEDMPTKVAAVPARGLKLSVKDMTAAQVQRLYLGHVHGILFRLIGEVFAALPSVASVTASGYSQRPDPSTGSVTDEYLISVAVPRERWHALNFGNLGGVDVVEALGALGAVRSIQRTGKLVAVKPLGD